MDIGEEKNGVPGEQERNGDMGLDLYEGNTYPFILKIWLEVAAEEGQPAEWRGHITDVLSKRRQYVRSVKEIVDFLVPYLENMGVEVDLPWPRWPD